MDRFFERFDDITGEVIIYPELLSIQPFDKIWLRDKSKHKEQARKELTFIWGMCCKDETVCMYADIINRDERYKLLIEDLWGKTSFNPSTDLLIIDGIKKYMERNPKNEYDEQVEFLYTEVERLKKFMREFKYENERTDSGSLVLKPEEIRKTIGAINDLVKDIDTMKNLAKEKREREKTIRGGGQEGLYENPNNATWMKNAV